MFTCGLMIWCTTNGTCTKNYTDWLSLTFNYKNDVLTKITALQWVSLYNSGQSVTFLYLIYRPYVTGRSSVINSQHGKYFCFSHKHLLLFSTPPTIILCTSSKVKFKIECSQAQILGGHKSFLWGHWYPCYRLLMMSVLGFKVRVNPLLACFLTCVILRFTSGVTPADCISIEVSMAAQPFQSPYLRIMCPLAGFKPTIVHAASQCWKYSATLARLTAMWVTESQGRDLRHWEIHHGPKSYNTASRFPDSVNEVWGWPPWLKA